MRLLIIFIFLLISIGCKREQVVLLPKDVEISAFLNNGKLSLNYKNISSIKGAINLPIAVPLVEGGSSFPLNIKFPILALGFSEDGNWCNGKCFIYSCEGTLNKDMQSMVLAPNESFTCHYALSQFREMVGNFSITSNALDYKYIETLKCELYVSYIWGDDSKTIVKVCNQDTGQP